MHELNFLPLSYRKNVTLPKVVIEPKLDQAYGGYYSEGVIVVVENEHMASTLAHEFRHHLQSYYGCTCVPVSVTKEDLTYENYFKFIRNYFRSSWSEMDALLFESKFTPTSVNNYWLKGLVTPRTLPLSLCM